MKLLKLTDEKGNFVLVNPDKISLVKKSSVPRDGMTIMIVGDETLRVRESLDSIDRAIRATEVDK